MEVWTQSYNPSSNIWLSAFIAALPIFLFFGSLVFLKLKGWIAALLTVLLSFILAVFYYDMPINSAIFSFIQGFITGLWPIAWIIIAAIFLYKLSVESGYFEIIKSSIMTITPDHRIQVILIAFCFGAFLEGAIGFGGPVAITAALLVGLGLKPLYAAGLCLIANTAPVAFGAIGIPIIAMGKAVGVDPDLISIMISRILPPITCFVPFFIVFLMDGFKGIKETFPAVSVATFSFAITQYFTASHLGPALPDITSALVSIVLTTSFLKYWKIKKPFRLDDKTDFNNVEKIPLNKLFKAWLPFLLLVVFVILWQSDFIKTGTAFANFKFELPYLHNLIAQNEPIVSAEKIASGKNIIEAFYTIDLIKAAGTAILLASLLSIIFLGIKCDIIVKSAKETIKEMFIPIITIGLVVAYAFLAKNSGQAATMGLALSTTGSAFAFFSPIIGWIGVFLTGSDTSSNLLFGVLQQVTAHQLNVPEVLFLAANTVGGVVGKMISPQSIAIACAAVGLVGKESELFRFTIKYSVLFIILVSIIVFIIANFIPSLVPVS